MILRKTWKRRKYRKGYYYAVYTGWFLFGLVPLYIIREERALA